MSENISRVKNKTKNFSIVVNECFQRKDMSARAKGILIYLLTLPDDWKIHRKELFTHFVEGKEALNSAFNELIEKGYIEYKQVMDGTRFNGMEYFVYESPITVNGFSGYGKAHSGKPDSENPPLLSTHLPITHLQRTDREISSVEDMPSAPDSSSKEKPVLSDKFIHLYERIKKGSVLNKELFKKGSDIPLKEALFAEKMIEYLLEGTFIEKGEIKVSKAQKGEWLNDMTEERIIEICSRLKSSKTGSLAAFLRKSYGDDAGYSAFLTYAEYVPAKFVPHGVKNADIPEKVQKMALTISNRFDVTDTSLLTQHLMEIYTWEEDNHEDLNWLNDSNPQVWGSFMNLMNTLNDYLGKWGESVFTPSHFKLNGKTWKWFADQVKDEYGVTLVVDHKKARERKERYEKRCSKGA